MSPDRQTIWRVEFSVQVGPQKHIRELLITLKESVQANRISTKGVKFTLFYDYFNCNLEITPASAVFSDLYFRSAVVNFVMSSDQEC